MSDVNNVNQGVKYCRLCAGVSPQCNDLKEVKKVLKVSIPLLVTIYKFVFQLAFSDSVQYPQKLFYKLLEKHYIAASPFAWGGNHSNSSLLQRFPLWDVTTKHD